MNLGKVTRGDTRTVQFTLAGANLPAGGVAGFSFWFTAKEDIADTDATATIHKTTPDFTVVNVGGVGTDAVVTCDILSTDTDTLPDYPVPLQWDFQVKDSAGRITTSASGTLTIIPDVTRAEV